MFEGEVCLAVQTHFNNGTITPKDQKVSIRVLDTTQTTIKEEEHFWHYKDKTYQISDKKKKKYMHLVIASPHLSTVPNSCTLKQKIGSK